MSIQPQTETNLVLDDINAVLCSGSHFLSQTDFQIKKLTRDANKVKDHAERLFLLGAIAQLCGDREEVDSKFNAAKIASGGAPHIYRQYGHALWNLGFCSDARQIYLNMPILESGMLSLVVPDLFGLLSVGFMCSLFARGEEMKITNLLQVNVDAAKRVKSVMDSGNVSDELASQILDEAGHVMRSHRVMRLGDSPTAMHIADRNGVNPFVMVTWRLPVSFKEAASMNAELADRLVRKFDDLPDCFSVSFEGSQ